MEQFELHLEGEQGAITSETFLEVMRRATALLRDVERALHGGRRSFDWPVTDLRTGSLQMTLGARRRSKEVPHNLDGVVISSFQRALAQIESEPAVPAYFTWRSLERLQKLCRQLSQDGAEYLAVRYEGREARVSGRTEQHLRELMDARYETLGSVTGHLETVSVHNGDTCTIYEELHGKAVSCLMTRELLDEASTLLDRRVRAHGTLYRNALGQPVRLRVDRLEVLRRDEDLPAVDDIYGSDPDFTGGQDTEEYLEELRGG